VTTHWFTGARIVGTNALQDIRCDSGRITAIEPHLPHRNGHSFNGALVMGALAHWHTHLDKTFTIDRAQQTEPGLLGAIKACEKDQHTWSADDIYHRANTALEQSWQAGCSIIRSHVNWVGDKEPLAWVVLSELAQSWKGRIDLQRVALIKSEVFDEVQLSEKIAKFIVLRDGMLGAFIHSINATPTRIKTMAVLAKSHGVSMDLHLDEEINPNAMGLKFLLEALGAGEHPSVAVSHVCAMSVKPAQERDALVEGLASAKIEVIALPATNLYLQDQSNPAEPVTPNIRGIAPVHELKRAGVTVKLSCDNVQDPFYPWGTYDPIDLMQIAAPSLQLVNCFDDWANTTAANIIAVGQPANMTVFPLQSANSWPANASMQQNERQIIRQGIVS
jgi:cytosine/creatinine deaminase